MVGTIEKVMSRVRDGMTKDWNKRKLEESNRFERTKKKMP
jgi:hypothetical protein